MYHKSLAISIFCFIFVKSNRNGVKKRLFGN